MLLFVVIQGVKVQIQNSLFIRCLLFFLVIFGDVMKRLFQYSVFIVIATGLWACASSGGGVSGDVKDGGPCKYEIHPFKVQIVQVEKLEADATDSVSTKDIYAIHLMNIGGYTGPKTLNEIYRTDFDSSFVARNKLTEGKVLTGRVKELVQGTCKPYLYWFDKPFSK